MPDEKDLRANLETINLRETEKLSPEAGQEKPLSPEAEPRPALGPEKPEIESAPAGETEGKGGEIAPASRPAASDAERQKQIELVLAKDMEGFYMEMNEAKRQEFKKTGEETAGKISELAAKGKATARKILDLIKKWLALIPGVNKYFLEQEAKIKTDEILRITKSGD